jgi:UrcA family protein
MNRFNTLLILTLGLCAAADCVAAPPLDNALTRSIPLAGLDLSRPADAAQLYGRIEKAATYVCQPFSGDDLARKMHYRKCVSGTIARAVSDVHAPLLTQYVALADARILTRQ